MKRILEIFISIAVLVCFFSMAFAKEEIGGVYKYKENNYSGTLKVTKSGEVYKIEIMAYNAESGSDCAFDGEGSFDGATLNAYDTDRYGEKVLLPIKIDGRQAIVPEVDGFCGVGAYLGGTFTKE